MEKAKGSLFLVTPLTVALISPSFHSSHHDLLGVLGTLLETLKTDSLGSKEAMVEIRQGFWFLLREDKSEDRIAFCKVQEVLC